METPATGQAGYALGHSQHELARLSRQAQVFSPFTRQLFEQAGVGVGMSVLDVGSGAGDVSLLASELVGNAGRVVGVDRVPEAVEWARARAHSGRIGNVDFLLGDPAEMEFSRPFDAIVGRFVLMYYPDPVDAVFKLTRHLRPLGHIVFQEFDMQYVRSLPAAPTFECATELMKRTLRATDTRIELGTELYSVFLAAGLPGPSLRMDILIGGGAEFQGYEILAEMIQSLLPAMQRFGIVAPAELGSPTLAGKMRDEVIASKGVALSPALIGAWSRKPEPGSIRNSKPHGSELTDGTGRPSTETHVRQASEF
jgi:ubiquinone/menaquinone biosynthesis C-methylase UbiE